MIERVCAGVRRIRNGYAKELFANDADKARASCPIIMGAVDRQRQRDFTEVLARLPAAFARRARTGVTFFRI
jgi:hypothetical protein